MAGDPPNANGFAEKVEDLLERLRTLPGAVVAFSGGVDSAMLLHACRSALGDRVLAVTADSPSLPRAELREAQAFARRWNVRHQVVATRELHREEYARNGSDRCYFCKDELFEVTARELGRLGERDWPVLYGAIADDLSDHRPGARAAAEHGVLAPLAEAGWSKEEVRRYSSQHGLSTADKPSLACLASRLPYGTRVDVAILGQVERAEAVLHGAGFRQFRVRHHGDVARVEVSPDQFQRALELRDELVRGVRSAGYRYVALDLQGYRTGALNEVLEP